MSNLFAALGASSGAIPPNSAEIEVLVGDPAITFRPSRMADGRGNKHANRTEALAQRAGSGRRLPGPADRPGITLQLQFEHPLVGVRSVAGARRATGYRVTFP